MSGIVAVFSKDSEKFLDFTKAMLSKIKHRGIGKRNVYKLSQAVLGQNHVEERSIPKFRDSGTAVIADANITVKDNASFEETIMDEYEDKGEKFVNNLDGPFAFVISDKEELMAARDPLGLKPLYYSENEDKSMVFASEIKALSGNTGDINEFPPGHYFKSDKGFVKYYDISKITENKTITSIEAVGDVREKLIEAMNKRYEPNKDSGVFLSGGVDSSVIAAVCREVNERTETFSVGVEGSEDLQKAKRVAKHIGSKHYEYIYDLDEMLKILPKVIYYLESFDMYLVRSAVANYILSRMAREKGMDLIYCGEGADEIFAGYQYLKTLDPKEVNHELKRLTFSSYKNCFQRVDRMLTAFSMEPQLPFADNNVAEYALKLPVKFKLRSEEGDLVEKWVLRKAFEKDLPCNIIWREKQKFSEGAGSAHYLKEYAEENITDEQFYKKREITDGFVLRSKEELMYYNIFREFFPHRSILETIGRTRTK